jgi:hypothetical protein
MPERMGWPTIAASVGGNASNWQPLLADEGFAEMDFRIYEALAQFNQRLDQVLESLILIKKLSLERTDYLDLVRVRFNEIRASTNGQCTERICRQEREEEDRFYGLRRKREKQWEDCDEIYLEIRSREQKREQQGLPPRVVILPWSQANDDQILAAKRFAEEKRNDPKPPTDAPLQTRKEGAQP